MDPVYFNNWLRQQQSQNVSSLHSPNEALSPGRFTQPTAKPPVTIASSTLQSNVTFDEPLDLRIKPDNSAPLDLTVNRFNSNIATGYSPQPEKASSYSSVSASTQLSSHLPCNSLETGNSPRARPYIQHAPKSVPYSTDKKLHCVYCGYQCDPHLKEGFDRHLARHGPRSIQFVCIHCQKSFADQQALHDHLPLHNFLYQHICSWCGVAFCNQTLYMSHMNEMHRSSIARPDRGLLPQMPQEQALLRIASTSVSPADRRQNPLSPFSNDTRSSPLSNHGASSSTSPTMSVSAKSTSSRQPTFGQTLAKQIEVAISNQVTACGKSPSLSELMFMKTGNDFEGMNTGMPLSKPAPLPSKNPLNLMTLLDKVVEESIRAGSVGKAVEKPDLKFMVTFSDDEEEKEVKECDSTVANGSIFVDSMSNNPVSKSAMDTTVSNDNTEDLITSTGRPVESPATNELAPKEEKRT